ncbi:MAG: hypothetical protein M3Q10_05415, partial [Chloroflexota bacterium]|nr:hypothetical protein [Chloroflexota bacterium]
MEGKSTRGTPTVPGHEAAGAVRSGRTGAGAGRSRRARVERGGRLWTRTTSAAPATSAAAGSRSERTACACSRTAWRW